MIKVLKDILAVLLQIFGNIGNTSKALAAILTVLTNIATTLAEIKLIEQEILAAVTLSPTAKVIIMWIKDGQNLGDITQMQLTDVQSVVGTLNPKDAKGAPSSIDPTKTTATTDNPAVATVTVDSTGLVLTVVAVGVGSCQLTGSATDASDPTDVVMFTPVTIDVISSATRTIDIAFGPPQ